MTCDDGTAVRRRRRQQRTGKAVASSGVNVLAAGARGDPVVFSEISAIRKTADEKMWSRRLRWCLHDGKRNLYKHLL